MPIHYFVGSLRDGPNCGPSAGGAFERISSFRSYQAASGRQGFARPGHSSPGCPHHIQFRYRTKFNDFGSYGTVDTTQSSRKFLPTETEALKARSVGPSEVTRATLWLDLEQILVPDSLAVDF